MAPQDPEFLHCSGLLVLNPQRPSSNPPGDPLLLKQVISLDAVLPPLVGREIRIEMLPRLSAYRGRLLSCEKRGTPVYAASFIRRRSIVLESALLRTPRLLRAILVHELSHFVWVRLGNSARKSFASLLEQEQLGKACGELGESAAVHKAKVIKLSPPKDSRQWRDYVCESFCDTSAAILVPDALCLTPRLAQRWFRRRYDWLIEESRDGWRL